MRELNRLRWLLHVGSAQFASLIVALRFDVFDCSPLSIKPSWQYIHLMTNLVEMREIPCVKPSEEQAGRGFCDQCLRAADDFAFEANRVLSATASIVRSEVTPKLSGDDFFAA